MKKTDEKYLPIGTVVMLKGGKKRVMITGFCIVSENHKEKVWDYGGCLFPEGIVDSKQTCAFNHDQIETIFHYGLVDDEEVTFKKQLGEMIQQRESEKEE